MRCVWLLTGAASAAAFTVDPAVRDSLRNAGKAQGQADVFVQLPDFGRDLAFAASLSGKAAKKAAVHAHLSEGAGRTQRPLLEALKNVSIHYPRSIKHQHFA